MSTTDTPLLAQLCAVLDLTHTEIQVAHMRSTQARTDAVRRELSEFADTARARADALEDSIRELGGAPEVIGPFLGRPAAAVKALTAQAQPFDEALLDDLALEHHLLDRARYIKILAITAQIRTVVVLADRLIAAHSAATDWLTTALAEHALGGPAALRHTPVAGGRRFRDETGQRAAVLVHPRPGPGTEHGDGPTARPSGGSGDRARNHQADRARGDPAAGGAP